MTPRGFLTFAQATVKQYPVAACYRSAVSRAYYTAHHVVKNFVQNARVSILKQSDAHIDVCNHLSAVGDEGLEWVGSELANLRGDRNNADYELNDPQHEKLSNVNEVIELVEEIVRVVEACLVGTNRYNRVRDAIRKRNTFLRNGPKK